MPRSLAAAVFAAIVFAAAAPSAHAASFDCGRAYTALERAVCQDRTLSALDEEMAENYLGLLRRISGKTESMMKAEQKAWLRDRNACDADERCIASQYRARIKRIADVASDEGLILLPKRGTAAATAAPANPTPRSIFQPQPANETASTQPIRTTAQEATAPSRAEGISLPQPKSPGLIKKVLEKVAPNLVHPDEGDTTADEVVDTPRTVRVDEPRRETARREVNTIAPEKALPPDQTPAPRNGVTTTREPAIVETPDNAPVALAPPEVRTKKTAKAEPADDPGAPAVLLYTTPDTSRVVRMQDGESPFDQLDAQGAFTEPPGPPLKVTPKSIPEPSKRAFDAGRFDAFNDPPNG